MDKETLKRHNQLLKSCENWRAYLEGKKAGLEEAIKLMESPGRCLVALLKLGEIRK